MRGYHDVCAPRRRADPGLLILRWSAPLFFANATQFRDRIRDLVKPRPAAAGVLVVAEPITDIDTMAGRMLAHLDAELNAGGTHLAFAELHQPSETRSCGTGCSRPSTRGICRSVDEAVDAFHREVGS